MFHVVDISDDESLTRYLAPVLTIITSIELTVGEQGDEDEVEEAEGGAGAEEGGVYRDKKTIRQEAKRVSAKCLSGMISFQDNGCHCLDLEEWSEYY